jgi:hypothetical protein
MKSIRMTGVPKSQHHLFCDLGQSVRPGRTPVVAAADLGRSPCSEAIVVRIGLG